MKSIKSKRDVDKKKKTPCRMSEQEKIYQSGLQKLIIDTVSEAIEPAVDKFVNGKINKLRTELTDYITLDTKWKEEDRLWKENSDNWKKTAQPVVDWSLNWKTVWKMIKSAGIILTVIGGIVFTIVQIMSLMKG